MPRKDGYTVVATGGTGQGTDINVGPGTTTSGNFDWDFIFVYDNKGNLVGIWKITNGVNAVVSLTSGGHVQVHDSGSGKAARGLVSAIPGKPVVSWVTDPGPDGKLGTSDDPHRDMHDKALGIPGLIAKHRPPPKPIRGGKP